MVHLGQLYSMYIAYYYYECVQFDNYHSICTICDVQIYFLYLWESVPCSMSLPRGMAVRTSFLLNICAECRFFTLLYISAKTQLRPEYSLFLFNWKLRTKHMSGKLRIANDKKNWEEFLTAATTFGKKILVDFYYHNLS